MIVTITSFPLVVKERLDSHLSSNILRMSSINIDSIPAIVLLFLLPLSRSRSLSSFGNANVDERNWIDTPSNQ